MKNFITVQWKYGSQYKVNIELKQDEAFLLDCSGNSKIINLVWDYVCARIWWREGMTIKGNYDLISKTINGVETPLH